MDEAQAIVDELVRIQVLDEAIELLQDGFPLDDQIKAELTANGYDPAEVEGMFSLC